MRSRIFSLAGFAAVALVLSIVPTAGAQTRVATSAAQFLTIGTGARASSLGHAYTSLATGGEALFWNPAGAARSYDGRGNGSIFLSHSDWLMDVSYDAFGLTIPVLNSGAIGVSLAQVDYGRWERTTVDQQTGSGETVTANDLVLGLSYAQPLTDAFYIGGTAKYIRQRIYDMTATTGAFDIGFVLESDYLNGMRLAASIMNFGGKMQMTGVNGRRFIDLDPGNNGNNDRTPVRLETDKFSLPLSFKFGVNVPVVNTQSVRVDLLTDAHQTNDNALNADFGAQVRYTLGSMNLSLRGGYKDLNVEALSHYTAGGGIDLRLSGVRLGADYAYVPAGAFNSIQMLDLRVYF